MERDNQIGACCGEIEVGDFPATNIVLGAQWFEYKFNHILMKTLESTCGYLSVLPGAFAAYRWRALTAQNFKVLRSYFKRFTDPQEVLSDWRYLTVSFLAEDRIKSEVLITVTDEDP